MSNLLGGLRALYDAFLSVGLVPPTHISLATFESGVVLCRELETLSLFPKGTIDPTCGSADMFGNTMHVTWPVPGK
jgi:hypothetical protein